VHVAVMLRMMLNGRSMVVVNTHLKAGLEQTYEDFRVEQLKCLLEKVKDFQQNKEDIILCGDLNAHFENYDPVRALVYPFLKMCGFRNAYGSRPFYTHWGAWADCEVKVIFDYIMYLGNMRVKRVLQVPEESVIANTPERLPNDRYPSDHISLVADFEFLPDPSQRQKEKRRSGKVKHLSAFPDSLPMHCPFISLSSIAHGVRFLVDQQ